ncbi:hypothetical protein BC332_04140 [Capsicum chinense]|nr:hypothetical protein BC332_04140 [Capsicum chinense]
MGRYRLVLDKARTDGKYRLVFLFQLRFECETYGSQPISLTTRPHPWALCDKDQSTKKVLGMGNLQRTVLEVNKKRVKVVKPGSKISFPTTKVQGTYAPPFHVELFRNDQHRLRIVVDSESEVDLLVQTRHLRDIVVLVIRGLAQRFNSTSLNSLLKIET